jgi:hypothetical protein
VVVRCRGLRGCWSQEQAQSNRQQKDCLIFLLGIGEEAVREEKNLRYVRGLDAALEAAHSGAAQVAFLLKPVSVDEVARISFAGGVMPQKSTDFYPKLLSGLTSFSLVRLFLTGRKRGPATSAPWPARPRYSSISRCAAACTGTNLVADQLAATVGEGRRQADQARPVLLAPVGRGASDAAGVQRDSAADLGAAVTGGVRAGGLPGRKGSEEKKEGRWSVRELR